MTAIRDTGRGDIRLTRFLAQRGPIALFLARLDDEPRPLAGAACHACGWTSRALWFDLAEARRSGSGHLWRRHPEGVPWTWEEA